MKRRIKISLMLVLLMVVSTFTVAGTLHENYLVYAVCKTLGVSKTVWNDSNWTNEITAEVGEIVLFNITISYEAYEPGGGYMADNITVRDILPTTLAYISGSSSPYQESYIDDTYIYWNLSEDYGIYLLDGENVSIEFEAKIVTGYDEYENYAEAKALEHGSYSNWHLYGFDSAWVNVPVPDSIFEKKVKDVETGEWTEKTFQYATETVTFKIELIYFGNYNFTDIKIIDYLPEVTEYAGNANITPTDISEDGKTIWWNLTETLEDGEPCIITFDALVTGSTGDCTICGTNLVTVTATESETLEVFEAEDTANITSNYYDDPKLSYLPNNIDFGEQEQGWTDSDTFEIWNSGQQKLTYNIYENLAWISVTPTSGDSTGEHDDITVEVENTEGMESGYYSGNIGISSNDGNGNVFVAIYIKKEEPKPGVQIYVQINKKIFFGKVYADIINTGDVDVYYIEWNMTVVGGLLNRINKPSHGILPKPPLKPGDSKTISTGNSFGKTAIKFGFGRITITVNANAYNDYSEDYIEKVYNGFILGRLIIIRGEIKQED
jgi:hypothetical protein